MLVNVWASWCVPCRAESPALERFYAAHRGHDFTILGIDSNDLTDDARPSCAATGSPIRSSATAAATSPQGELGTTGCPESFLVNPQGKLVVHSLGPVTDAYLNANVAPYLDGEAKR